MMDLTDRHCRYFHRLLTRHSLLYTEMVTTGALIHGDVPRHLVYNAAEHPLALQLGGSNAEDLAYCATLAQSWGYDEVNLNCGCPSDRVQNGAFGACLMKDPATVGAALRAMKKAVDIPVTVKCRIGVDDLDSYENLRDFASECLAAGADALIVHARKAWLKGLSPRQNREIPPLRYEDVYRLKTEFADVHISINGGIEDLQESERHLRHVDGVMVGRSAYYDPTILLDVDARIFSDPHPAPSMAQIIEQMARYIAQQTAEGVRVSAITRHMLGLFQGLPGARQYRRYISERAPRADATADVLLRAYELIIKHAQVHEMPSNAARSQPH